ncbi:MAG: (2Fe-2S) ferredoxin domain-containing protein [Magnetospiraceae bacterium]
MATAYPELLPQIIRVCVSPGRMTPPSCKLRDSEELLATLKKLARDCGAPVAVQPSICLSHCDHGPNVRILGGAVYHSVTQEDLPLILADAVAACSAGAKH